MPEAGLFQQELFLKEEGLQGFLVDIKMRSTKKPQEPIPRSPRGFPLSRQGSGRIALGR